MEVRGIPGGEAWIRATVKAIQIRETGTSYFVQLEGCDEWHEVDAADILFDTDPAEALGTIKEYPGIKCDTLEPPEMPAVKFETPETPRRRGRPKKATVEGLMAKAEQAKIRKEGGDLWDS